MGGHDPPGGRPSPRGRPRSAGRHTSAWIGSLSRRLLFLRHSPPGVNGVDTILRRWVCRRCRATKLPHRGYRFLNSGSHAMQHVSRVLVGLELKRGSASARNQRVALKVVANLVGEDANGPPIRSRLVAHRVHEALVVNDQTVAGAINDSHRVAYVPGPDVEVRLQPGVTCDARQRLSRDRGASEGIDAAVHPSAIESAILGQMELLDLTGKPAWPGQPHRAEAAVHAWFPCRDPCRRPPNSSSPSLSCL